jgi:hypothetical protein
MMKKSFEFKAFFFCLIGMGVFLFHFNGLYAQDNTETSVDENSLAICSFNIQFLGNSTTRENKQLAALLKDYDIVVVQELVTPPDSGICPVDSIKYSADKEARVFFDEMALLGFKYLLSIEDTGSGEKNHSNSSSTEWWVVFYKPGKVEKAPDLPTEFLAGDRSNHPSYERVPHAFSFRTPDNNMDFVLISVHLQPGSGSKDKSRRKEELTAIAKWIDQHDQTEKDFIILGDMNIEDLEELKDTTPRGFRSLNKACIPTNTNVNGPKPYDHVMYRSRYSKEIDKKFGFRVYNLIEAMRSSWSPGDPYPGGALNPVDDPPYNHNAFRQLYSDHHPVVFKMNIPDKDDD